MIYNLCGILYLNIKIFIMRLSLILIFLTIALGKDIYWVEYVNAKFVLKKGTVFK